MQAAMRGMSIRTFQASAGGSGTSKLLVISMPSLSQPLFGPARNRDEGLIVMDAADQLNADGQTLRPLMGRERDGRSVQRGPEFLKARIAGGCEAQRRFPGDAGRQQNIAIAEH